MDSSESLPCSILLQLTQCQEDIFLRQRGYQKIRKISDTLQGDIWECQIISGDNGQKEQAQKPHIQTSNRIAIKRTDKYLFREKITIQEDINFIVDENILKESVILKHLTYDNQPIGDTIVKFIEFFESLTDYYLVEEYVPSEYTLKQFVHKSHEYLKNGQLNIKEYQKIIKFIFWQLCVTIQWMHQDMNCMQFVFILFNFFFLFFFLSVLFPLLSP